ncbi:microsomal signal peptidase [Pisolithus croceorrhizus]|nr:microsomal signal peptidase [Pisolithus croceorrhizus]
MAPLQDIFEGKIDFIGQKRVDSIARVALAACTIASFAAGYVVQSLRVTMGAFALSTLLVAVMVVPPWPVYNRHPVQWRKD